MADPAAPGQPTTEPSDPSLYCPGCMYDLRGLAGDQCPECGFDLGEDSLARSSIPWTYRKVLNRPWVLLLTAWRVLRRPRLFAMALARPVDRRSALAFRLTVINLVWLVFAICWSLAVWDDASAYLELDYWEDEVDWLYAYEEQLEALAELGPTLIWFNVGFGVLVWIWLYLISGVQTYFAHRRGGASELDGRAVTLAYYACGPLLLMIFPSVLMLASGYVYEFADHYDGIDGLYSIAGAMFYVSWMLVLLVFAVYLGTCVRFTGLLSGGGIMRCLMTATLLPLAWLGLGLLVFGLIPGCLLLLYFVFATI